MSQVPLKIAKKNLLKGGLLCTDIAFKFLIVGGFFLYKMGVNLYDTHLEIGDVAERLKALPC